MIINNIPNSKHSKEKIEIECDVCHNKFTRRYDGYCKVKKTDKDYCLECRPKAKRPPMPQYTKERIKAAKIRQGELNKVTLTCAYCGKDFTVKYGERERICCSKSCASKKMIRKPSIKTLSQCMVCNKEFSHYGLRKMCSRECTAKHMSLARVGENNPGFKPKEKAKCIKCGKNFEYNRAGLHKGQKRIYCSLKCANTGAGGEYAKEFNSRLKGQIREKYEHRCMFCGKIEGKEKHSVHHINYQKKDCSPNNLALLCRGCHAITNFNRYFWQTVFNCINSGCKMVQKLWGLEIHIVNHKDYCCKYLVFFKNCSFSNHFHIKKKEAWHCMCGRLEAILTNKEKTESEYVEFGPGEGIELEPGLIHQVRALEGSILLEVSTHAFDEDSIRLQSLLVENK